MTPTPREVLPILECAVPELAKAVRLGVDFADETIPNPQPPDAWFWSDCARWQARRSLVAVKKDGWTLLEQIPNSGIHLRLGTLHKARVLRSFAGSTPSPGSNRRRRQDWTQGALTLATNETLPPLSLILDWDIVAGEPVIHAGLPKHGWAFQQLPELYWRVPVTGDADSDLGNLTFEPGLLPGDVTVTVNVDPAERLDESDGG